MGDVMRKISNRKLLRYVVGDGYYHDIVAKIVQFAESHEYLLSSDQALTIWDKFSDDRAASFLVSEVLNDMDTSEAINSSQYGLEFLELLKEMEKN